MREKGVQTIVIGFIFVLVVAAGAVGAYTLMSDGNGSRGSGGGEAGGDETGGGGTGGETGDLSSASSIDFKMDYSGPAGDMTYRFRARQIGTDVPDIRVDMDYESSEYEGASSVILSGTEQEGWLKMNGDWVAFSEMPGFDWGNYWDEYYSGLEDYTGYLEEGWDSGEYTYQIPNTDITLRYYDIRINPDLSGVFHP